MLPKTPVTGAGQIVVTTPEVTVKADAPGRRQGRLLPDPGSTMRLFGYQYAPAHQGGLGGLGGRLRLARQCGRDAPAPVPVISPPFAGPALLREAF